MKEAIVFIDNGYLSKISKHLGNGTHLNVDVNQLAITLAKSQGLWCKGVYFYTAPPFQAEPPTEEQAARKARHDKFIAKMRRIQDFVVREGRCQKVDGEYKQKGVDTWLTMDLLTTSTSKPVTTIILLACDTDFVPILNQVRGNGIEVILFYYSDFRRHSKFSMSNHILTACDKCVLLDRSHFDQSMRPQSN